MGLAAILAVGLSVGVWLLRSPSEGLKENDVFQPSQVAALVWPSADAFDPSGKPSWGTRAARLPSELPNFNNAAGGTLGAIEDRYVDWRLATVIVRTESGFGSGAFVSTDGWIITNYHVIARAAQTAALTGAPAKADIITGQVVNGRVRPAAQPLSATVFRADPQHDLALLKLDTLPAEGQVKAFSIAEDVAEGAACYVIGSQNNGPAWWIRAGNITHIFEFPDDLSQVAAGVAEPTISVDRNRAMVLVTDTRISQGDSGGPLLNAAGELIGVTFATPANLTGGSIGWHIALAHIQAFLANRPSQPEGVPFDLWTMGNPDSTLLEPQILDPDDDGSEDALVYHYALENADGRPASFASVAFVSFEPLTQAEGTTKPEPVDHVPYGLWGIGSEGRFRFDIVMASRVDGIRLVGYTDATGKLDELRLSMGQGETTSIQWRRQSNGSWKDERPASPLPLVDPARIGPAQKRKLETIIGNLSGHRPESPESDANPARSRGPNRM